MYNILRDLYCGRLRVIERPLTGEYRRLLERFNEADSAFADGLTQQQKSDYEALMDRLEEMRFCYEEETFCVGFSLGVRILLEAMHAPTC